MATTSILGTNGCLMIHKSEEEEKTLVKPTQLSFKKHHIMP